MFYKYRKYSIYPLGRLIILISDNFERAEGGRGRLIETGTYLRGGGGGLLNLATMVVSVLHKDLECKVEKLKNKKLEVMQRTI